MADGEINRNGATIRIDDDGGVQVEPAEGQEVEYTGPDRGTDAIRDSVNTEQIGNERHYAGGYDGSDVETRLDNALAAASDGDVIYLESASYDSTRTVTTRVKFEGTNEATSGADIAGDWTLPEFSGVTVRISGSLTLKNQGFVFGNTHAADITVTGSNCRLIGLQGNGATTITFESDTSNGIIDSSSRVSITDNGSNTVGDIA